MGTVHSLKEAAVHPDRLRQRFDLALPSSPPGQDRSVPEIPVFGGIFFFPFQATGQVADEMLRDATLFGLAYARQQLRFFCLLP